MKIYNPSESTVTITLDGTVYSVDSKSSVEVSDGVGVRWMETHKFLQIPKEEPVEEKKTAKKTAKKEDKEDK